MALLPLSHFRAGQDRILDSLRQMVEMESPTPDKGRIDMLGAWVSAQFEACGGTVERMAQADAGDHWLISWGSGDGGTLLLHHLDTVHAVGTIGSMPWKLDDGRARGPGVLDMKGGIAVSLGALQGLHAAGTELSSPIRCLLTSDEETGSRTSRQIIEDLARRHTWALCLEPALPNGSLKTRRKGTGVFVLEATGRAAHAGNNPEAGVNAILEMAHQIPRVHALASPASGTTVAVGVIEGGTRTNVVPEHCRVRIDVRVVEPQEQPRVEAGFAALRPVLPGARLAVRGGWNRPPMTRTPAIVTAFERARRIGGSLGLDLSEGGAGGGSDANFVAALGSAVLDGLGPRGDGAHSSQEYVEVDSLSERAMLVAALLTED
jgi:glutamate carboxypeptidase